MAEHTLLKAALFSLGGAVVGGLHAVVSYLVPLKSEHILCSPYTQIQYDPLLLDVLHEIDADFKELDFVAAIRTITAIDELLGLRRLLDKAGHEPLVSDRASGIVYFRKARRYIQRFLICAEALKDPRRVIYIQRHTQTIMRQLEKHLQCIIMSTRDMYMHP